MRDGNLQKLFANTGGRMIKQVMQQLMKVLEIVGMKLHTVSADSEAR